MAGSTAVPRPGEFDACGGQEACRARCDRCGKGGSSSDAAACELLGRHHLRNELKQFDLSRALGFFEAACSGGAMVACSAAALQLQDGRGAAQDLPRALQLYERACDGGAGVACYNLALMYAQGNGVDIDEDRAGQLFLRAKDAYEQQCRADDQQWCMNLGVLYELGHGVPKDTDRARTIYRSACDRGHDESCVNLALMQLESAPGTPPPEDALALIRRACDRNVALGCGVLGQVHLQGKGGVGRDTARAVPLLERGCEGGNPHACGTLGAVLALADDLPRDLERATRIEQRACELGLSSACLVLGLDDQERRAWSSAAAWFDRGCRIGDGESCGMLAASVDAGQGAQKDPRRALSLYRAACRQGYPSSCVVLIQRKQPLPLPERHRQVVLRMACDRGVQDACRLLK